MIARDDLLRALARHCYVWPPTERGYPAIKVDKSYYPDYERFLALGGRLSSSFNSMHGYAGWIVEYDEALTLMRELQPYVFTRWRQEAIRQWLQN